MTRTKGRKDWICKQCGQIIPKGEIHEVHKWESHGYYHINHFHDKCYKIAEQEASDRTQARWNEAKARGEDPFKWIR